MQDERNPQQPGSHYSRGEQDESEVEAHTLNIKRTTPGGKPDPDAPESHYSRKQQDDEVQAHFHSWHPRLRPRAATSNPADDPRSRHAGRPGAAPHCAC